MVHHVFTVDLGKGQLPVYAIFKVIDISEVGNRSEVGTSELLSDGVNYVSLARILGDLRRKRCF